MSHLTFSADTMYTGINSGTGLFANESNSSGIWTGLVRVQHVFYQ